MRFAPATNGSGQKAKGKVQSAQRKALSVEYQESEGYALCAMRYAISAMRLAPAATGQLGDASRS
jgi:hypothetical protein